MSNDPNDKITGPGNEDAGKKRLLEDLDEMLHADEMSPATNESFEKESAEGLAQINSDKVPVIIEQLNRHLHQQIKKTKRSKSKLPGLSFVNITVITVLLLIIIAYIVIRKMHS